MRDYSFLFSDDADLHATEVETRPENSTPKSYGHFAQWPLQSKFPIGKSAKLVPPISNGSKIAESSKQRKQRMIRPTKEAPLN